MSTHPVTQARTRLHSMHIDLASILSIKHVCGGCTQGESCCCATYEVCVTATEIAQIIKVLPEAALYCAHLEHDGEYDNVFEEVEPGLYAIDTDEGGLCLFAYKSNGKVRCSLHSAARKLELPLSQVKPKACLLWPMSFSEGDEVLSLTDNSFSFKCNTKRTHHMRRMSPSFVEAISHVYGKGLRDQLVKEAAKGSQQVSLTYRR